MSKIFSRTFRVRWSEINARGQVDIPGFLRYLVETAWDWGASRGLGIAENDQLGLAWVIRETEMRFFKPLRVNDVFDFTIWLLKWRRVRGTRCFEVRLADNGELIAQGLQQVVTLDGQTQRPTPPPAEIIGRFIFENPPVIQGERFPDAPSGSKANSTSWRRVEWRDLDTLEHVNNATYAAYALEAATRTLADLGWPPGQLDAHGLALQVQRFHIRYQSPAFWGDRLDINTVLFDLNESGGSWYIAISRDHDQNEICRCILEWTLVDMDRGVSQPLPADLQHRLSKVMDGSGDGNISAGG